MVFFGVSPYFAPFTPHPPSIRVPNIHFKAFPHGRLENFSTSRRSKNVGNPHCCHWGKQIPDLKAQDMNISFPLSDRGYSQLCSTIFVGEDWLSSKIYSLNQPPAHVPTRLWNPADQPFQFRKHFKLKPPIWPRYSSNHRETAVKIEPKIKVRRKRFPKSFFVVQLDEIMPSPVG